VFVLGGIFLFVAIFPISIAFARRIWRRGANVVAALPHDIVERFTQIDQAVESIAVEVERIGEGQRFITRVLAEQGRPALAEPAQRAVEVRSRPNG
jgi:predicted HD phosphohydrolase